MYGGMKQGNNHTHDRHRDAVALNRESHGAPPSSPYSRDLNDFRIIHAATESFAENIYDKHVEPTEKTNANDPEFHVGERNREGYLRAASFAEDAATKFKEAANARKKMREKYIGHHQLWQYREHVAAEEHLNKTAEQMYFEAQEHRNAAARMK